MRAFLEKGAAVGRYTVESHVGDTARFRIKDGVGEELVVRQASEEDMKAIFALIKSAQITGREISQRILGREGLGRSIGEGGLFSDYTGRKEQRMKEFRMLLGTPYLLVAVKEGDVVGFIAGFPEDKIAELKKEEGISDWKKHVHWHEKPNDTKKYVLGDPLVVAKGYRHRGVGEPLVRALLHNCAKAGMEEFHAEVVSEPIENTAPLRLLERLGFKETGREEMTMKTLGVDEPVKFTARVFTIKTS